MRDKDSSGRGVGGKRWSTLFEQGISLQAANWIPAVDTEILCDF